MKSKSSIFYGRYCNENLYNPKKLVIFAIEKNDIVMLLELLLSAAAVYGITAVYKAGKSVLKGSSGNACFPIKNGKYVFHGKTYDTLKEYSAAEWRQMERDRLERVDAIKKRGGDGPLDEAELRAKVKKWDKEGL